MDFVKPFGFSNHIQQVRIDLRMYSSQEHAVFRSHLPYPILTMIYLRMYFSIGAKESVNAFTVGVKGFFHS